MSGITHRWTEQLLGLTDTVDEVLAQLVTDDVVDQLWTGTLADEAGWVHLLAEGEATAQAASEFAAEVADANFSHVVVLADSEFSPFVRALLDRADRTRPGHGADGDGVDDGPGGAAGFRLDRRGTITPETGPVVHLADVAHPEVVARVVDGCPAETTLVVPVVGEAHSVSVLSLLSMFWERSGEDGLRFAAIAPAGSLVAELAVDRGFRRVFEIRSQHRRGAEAGPDPVALGGVFAALSPAGMVPAALFGLDPLQLLAAARETAEMLQATGGPAANLGLRLGAVIAAALRNGRNLLTFVVEPDHGEFARCASALVTTTLGPAGLIAVGDEGEADSLVAGEHRLYVGVNSGAGLNRVVGEGHPAVAIEALGAGSLAAHLLTWQFAAAVAMQALDIWPCAEADEPVAPAAAAGDTSGVVMMEGVTASELDSAPPPSEAAPATSTRPSEPVAEPEPAPEPIAALTLSEAEAHINPGDHVALVVSADPDGTDAETWAQERLRLRDRLGLITTLHFMPHTEFTQAMGASPTGDQAGLVVLQVPTHSDGSSAAAEAAVPGLIDTSFAQLAAKGDDDFYRSLQDRGINIIRLR